jgi:hypothetical protein
MQIVVSTAGSGTEPAFYGCTSTAPFLVHVLITQGGDEGTSIEVQSTGASVATSETVFVVGGIANDTVIFGFPTPQMNAFLTLQTEDYATASINSPPLTTGSSS